MVDARGKSCPIPVIMAKEALDKENKFDIIVDNETAKENITRFANSRHCKIAIKETEDKEYILTIEK